MRSGTLNVPGIVGFGEACAILKKGMRAEVKELENLRNRLRDRILGQLDDCFVNGSQSRRLSNNLNIGLRGVNAEKLMRALPQMALSSGSACLSTSPQASHVLTAIGLSEDLARSCIRIGVGRFNNREEVDEAARLIIRTVRRLRYR